MKNDAVES